MQQRIGDALPDDLREDFQYLMTRMATAEMDLDVAESKLRGTWPGWERKKN